MGSAKKLSPVIGAPILVKKYLGDIATVRTAVIFRDASPKEAEDGNVCALAIKDLQYDWPLDVHALPKINISDELLKHCLEPGEVVIPSRGAFYQARYFDGMPRMVFPIGQLNIITPGTQLEPAFLAWFLNRDETQRKIHSSVTGTNIKALNKGEVLGLEIDLPEIEIQRQISELQSLWAEIRQKYRRLVSLEEHQISVICNSLLNESLE
jgi:hypothetical protein